MPALTLLGRYKQAKDCRGCKFAGSDPDGGYCANPKSMAVSGGFGRSWESAKRDPNICGPEGSAFEPMERDRAKGLGLLRPSKDFIGHESHMKQRRQA